MGRIVVLQVPDRYPDIRDLMTNKGIRRHAFVLFFVWYVLHVLNDIIILFMYAVRSLTLFLPGEGRISPLIVYHVTKSVRNRVKVCSWQAKIR